MSLHGWFGSGWRHGLAVGFLCTLFGLAGSALVLRLERHRIIAEDGARLAGFAGVMAERLDSGLGDWAKDVGLLARFEVFERRPAEPASARRVLEDLKARSPIFSWIGFTGVDGRVIAATGGLLEGVDASARPWFRPGLEGLHLGDVHPAVMLAKLLPEDQGGGSDAYFVDAAAPVHAPDGTKLGVVSGHLTWRWAEAVRREMASLAPWQPAPVLRVLGADGLVLLGPEGERGKPWPIGRTTGGWREASLPGGGPAIFGYARAAEVPDRPHLGWVVVAERDLAAALAPLRSIGLWLGLGTLCIATLGGMLAGLYAGRMGSTLQRMLGGSGRGGDVARQLEQLRDQAWRDPLTGLLNRAGFAAWQRALPPLDQGCAVVALDLDGFKPINDTHGHAAGDEVLRGIGGWFRQNLRGEDAAVRLGGDEFLLCFVGPLNKVEAAAREVGARLNTMLREGVPTESGRLRLGCSLGVALMPRDATEMGQAIARADAALYEAKRHKVPVPRGLPSIQAAAE